MPIFRIHRNARDGSNSAFHDALARMRVYKRVHRIEMHQRDLATRVNNPKRSTDLKELLKVISKGISTIVPSCSFRDISCVSEKRASKYPLDLSSVTLTNRDNGATLNFVDERRFDLSARVVEF